MLSRIADNLFWAGRYIERAEASARLINATSLLLFDLPDGRDFDWHTLVEIMGAEAGFDQHHDAADEAGVMRYLATDRAHPGSISASLLAARERICAARAIMCRASSGKRSTGCICSWPRRPTWRGASRAAT